VASHYFYIYHFTSKFYYTSFITCKMTKQSLMFNVAGGVHYETSNYV